MCEGCRARDAGKEIGAKQRWRQSRLRAAKASALVRGKLSRKKWCISWKNRTETMIWYKLVHIWYYVPSNGWWKNLRENIQVKVFVRLFCRISWIKHPQMLPNNECCLVKGSFRLLCSVKSFCWRKKWCFLVQLLLAYHRTIWSTLYVVLL